MDTLKIKKKRHRQGLNLRGQSPIDFKSISLTTRTRCHGQNWESNPGPLAPKARIIPLDHSGSRQPDLNQ